ncbi:Tn3 family transposase TnXax1 [Halomonadaceae bacterium LMG 33818]|uniref:lytic murein transglycosylase n=1 Tax=Cernens ardua TaxID=3402176 RepID=UPI003EDBAFF7
MKTGMLFPNARFSKRLTRLGVGCSILATLAGCAQANTVPTSGARGMTGALSTQTTSGASANNNVSDAASNESDQNYTQAGFRQWINGFRAYALAHGISSTTFDNAFRTAQLQTSITHLSSSQPEFVRPIWQYLDTADSSLRVSHGRTLMERYHDVLAQSEARYGVPGSIIVAIWGMESNYGANFGNYPTVDALATLAYTGHRTNWAKSELVDALKIIQEGDIAPSRMRGSWAGAMGNTQFMPSSFLAYAVDADGDGRRDIWGDIPDVVASTANFLQHNGWRRGQPWGVEVRLPASFNYAQADGVVQHSVAQWAQMGVRSVNGGALPQLDEASILLPAGAHGPAFLIGHNFRTILRYNNSTSYALGVSLLAQQVAGGSGVQASWPRYEHLVSRTQKKEMQSALNQMGFNAGGADGIVGRTTQNALRQFQQAHGLAADGFVTQAMYERVMQAASQ